MTETTISFPLLHSLAIKGVASADALCSTNGKQPAEVGDELKALIAAGVTKERQGRIGGFTLTAEGRNKHAELLAEVTADAQLREAVADAYAGFLPLNAHVKELCTRWQLRAADGRSEPNDHSDPAYDAALVEELGEVHTSIVSVLAPLAERVPHFGRYPDRLGSALERLRGGDTDAFVRPMSESYHDVWMELHQDLLLSARKERSAQDGH